jgi:signal peptidase I
MSRRREGRGRAGASDRQPEGFLESVRTLVVALALAVVIRTFVVQTFYVPSGSMFPTLLEGDHVLVNKFLYGVRVPWTDLRLPGLREPARGDVVVFKVARTPDGRVIAPADRRRDLPREDFIKRIVGLPGDLVEVRQGVVFVNGQALPREPTGERFVEPGGRSKTIVRERVERCAYQVLDDPGRPTLDRSPVRVEPGRYFMMGDNRNDSNDSRYWGTVRLQEIHGPAGLLYWSWDFDGSWASLLNPLTWWTNLSERTRWARTGSSVSCP